MSLLDGLFSQELPPVYSEPLWPINTQSYPVTCPALRLASNNTESWNLIYKTIYLLYTASPWLAGSTNPSSSSLISTSTGTKKQTLNPLCLCYNQRKKDHINVTKSVAVRCQNFGSKVRTGTEQVHQSIFHRIIQMWIHRCLQGASWQEEGLDLVFVRKSGPLRRQQNTGTFTVAPRPKSQSSWLLQAAGMQWQMVSRRVCIQVSSLWHLHPFIICH